jgi:release factor glutamine methyltransferase
MRRECADPIVEMRESACGTVAVMLRTEGLSRIDARVLLRKALRTSDAHIAAHPEQVLRRDERDRFLESVLRRRAGEPIAYITGEREFYGLAFEVTPAVLIPRPETELLVDLALERMAPDQACSVLDLGTGSGCVAVAIAKQRPRSRIIATDISPDAIGVARENARRHSAGNIEFVSADWLGALRKERFDVIVANPPYVASGDPHLSQGDLRFEPRVALAGGDDGLDCIREIAAEAQNRLRPGGWLLIEHGCDQGASCPGLLRGLGYADVRDFSDLSGLPRVAAACRSG